MIPVAEAIRIVEAQTPRLPAEAVALAEARGRVLAEDVIADTDLPPFDRALMGGAGARDGRRRDRRHGRAALRPCPDGRLRGARGRHREGDAGRTRAPLCGG